MGLDMYLIAEKYCWGSTEKESSAETNNPLIQDLLDVGLVQKQNLFDDLGDFKLDTVAVNAGYWRKVNHIHQWFVTNIQDGEDDCRRYYVSRDDLTELKETCGKILLIPSAAEELLPTTQGFFFGDTGYNDWYFRGLRETVRIIDTCLKYPVTWDFYYRASW